MAVRNISQICVLSSLADMRGTKPALCLRVDAEDELLDAAFFDMDRTLLRLDFIYKPTLLGVFPDVADGEALWRLHSDGFKLGTSYREFDRLHGIVRDGRDAWADPDRYLRERQAIIDADGPERRRAADYTGVYAAKAFEVARAAHARDPGVFERAHIEPIVHLLRLLRRLGAATFCMTANNEEFARMVLAMSGLAGDFLDLAGDESTAGGGKEVAIRQLVVRAARRGLRVARDGIMLVGDSLVGDLGVG
ncbi:hypothetical protein HY633_05155, partial [Candidatus Uhrbacteria bacterium]|nr:hypothetical protein [Candidatus Uhrbacteria bacterium]